MTPNGCLLTHSGAEGCRTTDRDDNHQIYSYQSEVHRIFRNMSIGRLRFILLAWFVLESQAFAPVQRASFTRVGDPLMAKKKRRKRKAQPAEPPASSVPDLGPVSDELPDFELDPVPSTDDAMPSPKPTASAPTPPGDGGEAPITNAQMGKVKPMSSIKDLLNDRSLETALPFDEPVDAEPLPSFAEYKSGVPAPEAPVGSKKARQQARREAAIAREEEEEGGFFSNLPFIGGGDDNDGEKSDLTPLKVSACGRSTCTWLFR